MALFSGKIIEAHYIDNEYTLVEVLYEDDNGNLCSHALRSDPNNQDWKDLIADGWDQEKLLDGTAEYKRQHSAAFNTEVNAVAKALAQEMVGMKVIQEEKEKLLSEVDKTKKTLLDLDRTAKIRTKAVDGELYDYLLNENSNKEELFKCKLWALELELVKDASKNVKSSIRKATRITQVMGIVDKLI